MFVESETYRQAIRLIDEANGQDPVLERDEAGAERPRGLLYGLRMSDRLLRFEPGASEVVRLAARAQHIRRWLIPRDRYPKDRAGYHRWRTELYGFHGREAGEILRRVGYDEATIGRVAELLAKKRLKADPEAQLLEDVICLVFLEHYYTPFIAEHEDEKVVTILRRTWKKMSERGRGEAVTLADRLDGRAKGLILKALGKDETTDEHR